MADTPMGSERLVLGYLLTSLHAEGLGVGSATR